MTFWFGARSESHGCRAARVVPLLFILALILPGVAAAQTGTVTGRVTAEATGLGIPNLQVRVITYNGLTVAQALTNGTGDYAISNIPPGALYYVRVSGAAAGFVDELYPNVASFPNSYGQSTLNEADSISVAGGATVSGIDFALTAGATISGTVSRATGGTPVASAFVFAYIRIGTFTNYAGGAATDGTGAYTFQGLPPGSYYLFTTNSQGLQNEIFDNIPCVGGCSSSTIIQSGTPIAVAAGATATADFALETGGSVAGTVTNSATGSPAPGVTVTAYTKVGQNVVFGVSAQTNASGEYSVQGLSAGTYFLYTSAPSLTNEIYDNILCPLTCSPQTAVDSGTGVPVTLGAATGGVNFSLEPGGSISGTVTNESTSMPAQFVTVYAALRVGNSFFTRSATTNASGVYTIGGLPAGTYALFTASSTFANEIYDNIPCNTFGYCDTVAAIDTGTPVAVAASAAVTGRDFALQPISGPSGSGMVGGTVTDAATGLPIAGISVLITTQTGTGTASLQVTTDLTGAYSAGSLAAGSYFVNTLGDHPFIDELFDGLPCESYYSCDPTMGTPVVISSGGTGTADFALSRGDGITGTVTAAGSGTPLSGVTVGFYDTVAGRSVGFTSTNTAGVFVMRGLRNGTYVAYTASNLGFYDEIYDNVRCTTYCYDSQAATLGTPIAVTGAAAFARGQQLTTGINFALELRDQPPGAPYDLRVVTTGFTSQFTWNAPTQYDAGAATSYLLEAGLAPGTTFVSLPIAGTATSFSVPGVPPGRYYVRVRGVNAFGTGPASNEVTLIVGASGVALPETPTNLVAFVSNGLLTMTWSPAAGGGPAADYLVEAGSASGAANIATIPSARPVFSYAPVPNGFYFLRVRARNAAGVSAASREVMLVVGNAASPPGAPNFTSASVNGSTVTLNWTAPGFGSPTAYVIEAGSAAGLSNLATFNTGAPVVTQSFNGVPPGTYYVRIRAVNALGASVVSNERVVTVH